MADEYAQEITKQAAARACVALGINRTSSATLDCLADVVRHFSQSLSANIMERSEISSRAQPGIHDILSVLSDPSKPDSWDKLRDFAFENVKEPTVASSTRWNQPFPHDVPDFPERQKRRHDERSFTHENRIKASHVPEFLPPYPPLHTYKRTVPSGKKRVQSNVGNEVDNEAAQRAKRQATIKSVEESLLKIESSADGNISATSSSLSSSSSASSSSSSSSSSRPS